MKNPTFSILFFALYFLSVSSIQEEASAARIITGNFSLPLQPAVVLLKNNILSIFEFNLTLALQGNDSPSSSSPSSFLLVDNVRGELIGIDDRGGLRSSSSPKIIYGLSNRGEVYTIDINTGR
jgi:hypothetical protein